MSEENPNNIKNNKIELSNEAARANKISDEMESTEQSRNGELKESSIIEPYIDNTQTKPDQTMEKEANHDSRQAIIQDEQPTSGEIQEIPHKEPNVNVTVHIQPELGNAREHNSDTELKIIKVDQPASGVIQNGSHKEPNVNETVHIQPELDKAMEHKSDTEQTVIKNNQPTSCEIQNSSHKELDINETIQTQPELDNAMEHNSDTEQTIIKDDQPTSGEIQDSFNKKLNVNETIQTQHELDKAMEHNSDTEQTIIKDDQPTSGDIRGSSSKKLNVSETVQTQSELDGVMEHNSEEISIKDDIKLKEILKINNTTMKDQIMAAQNSIHDTEHSTKEVSTVTSSVPNEKVQPNVIKSDEKHDEIINQTGDSKTAKETVEVANDNKTSIKPDKDKTMCIQTSNISVQNASKHLNVDPTQQETVQNNNIKAELTETTLVNKTTKSEIRKVHLKPLIILDVMKAVGLKITINKDLYRMTWRKYSKQSERKIGSNKKFGPIEEISENDAENRTCKIICIELPFNWSLSHLTALLLLKTTFDPCARYVKMIVLNTSPYLPHKFLLRFLTHQECIQVYYELRGVKLFHVPLNIKLDIGYKIAKNTNIIGPLSDLGIKLHSNQNVSDEYMRLRSEIEGQQNKLAVNELVDVSANSQYSESTMKKEIIDTTFTEKIANKSVDQISAELKSQAADIDMSEVKSNYSDISMDEKDDNFDESDENHCRIVQISNLPMKSTYSLMKNLLKCHTSYGDDPMELRIATSGVALLQCSTHEKAVRLIKELSGFPTFGKKLELKLDIGHKATRNLLPQHSQFLSKMKSVPVKREPAKRKSETAQSKVPTPSKGQKQSNVSTRSKEVGVDVTIQKESKVEQSDSFDESDKNHCRIVQISNLPMKSTYSMVMKLLKYHSSYGNDPMELRVTASGIALLQCSTHEKAVLLIKELSGFPSFGKKLELKLDIGHKATRQLLPQHSQFLSKIKSVPVKRAPVKRKLESTQSKGSTQTCIPTQNKGTTQSSVPTQSNVTALSNVPTQSDVPTQSNVPSESNVTAESNDPTKSKVVDVVESPAKKVKYDDAIKNTPDMPVLYLPPREYNRKTYGLTLPYLKSLSIRPPLTETILINNLHEDVDVTKLHEIFSIAGNIKYLNIFAPSKAKIVYDHPVEAVQAISMFNKQYIFNMEINVRMDFTKARPLPLGLQSIGSGLGFNGEPLTGVRNYVDLKEIQHVLSEMGKFVEIPLTAQPFSVKYVKSNSGSTENINIQIPCQTQAPVQTPTQAPVWGAVQAPNAKRSFPPNVKQSRFKINKNPKPNIVVTNTVNTANESNQNPGNNSSNIAIQSAVSATALADILAQHGLIDKSTKCQDIGSILNALHKNRDGSNPTPSGNNNAPNISTIATNPYTGPNTFTNQHLTNVNHTNNPVASDFQYNQPNVVPNRGPNNSNRGSNSPNFIRNPGNMPSDAPNFGTNIPAMTANPGNVTVDHQNFGVNSSNMGLNAAHMGPNTNQTVPNAWQQASMSVPAVNWDQPSPPLFNTYPAQNYTQYGMTAPVHNMPAPEPNMAVPVHNMSAPVHNMPVLEYGMPEPVHNLPTPVHNMPAPVYGMPESGHDIPTPVHHNIPAPVYGMPEPTLVHNMPLSIQNTQQNFNETMQANQNYNQNMHPHQQYEHQNQPYQQENSSKQNDCSQSGIEKKKELASGDSKSDLLIFTNLPPSVTVDALNKKMRQIGEVVFGEITGQGRAIVRFKHYKDAELCIKRFHRSKVDRQIIEVSFV